MRLLHQTTISLIDYGDLSEKYFISMISLNLSAIVTFYDLCIYPTFLY